MLKCKGGPCSAKPAPPPPPCPVPPPRPFNWLPIILFGALMTAMGLLYRWWLWRQYVEQLNKPLWQPRLPIKRPIHEQDLPACVQYLIIGGGVAGWAAYLAIREHDKRAKIFIITKEDVLPYRRIAIGKYMWWNSYPPNVMTLNYIDKIRKSMYFAECKYFMDPVKFYRLKKGPAVSVATGWCVDRIDADDHVIWIRTNCGEVPIYYERCLYAPGSKPKNLTTLKMAPRSVRQKTSTLHSVRDLEFAYRKVREAKHVTVIGGGTLGTELAYSLARMGKEFYPPLEGDELRDYEQPKVVHIYKDKGILSSFVPEYLGEWAAEKLKCENVEMIPNTQVHDAYLSEDGKLELVLSNGQHVITDFALVAVGNKPLEALAKRSLLELDPDNGGYMVNAEMMSRQHLYIAGDAASYYTQWKHTRYRVEHYLTAEEQGYIAGANMTGYWIPANFEPHFYLTLKHDLDIEVVGEVGACMPTIGLFKPCDPMDPAQQRYEELTGEVNRPCYKDTQEWKSRYRRGIVFYLRNEIVVGMMFWNFPAIEDRKKVAQELLRAKVSYKEVDVLADLLGFKQLECVYIPPEMMPPREDDVCLDKTKYIWADPKFLRVRGKTLGEFDPAKKRLIMTELVAEEAKAKAEAEEEDDD